MSRAVLLAASLVSAGAAAYGTLIHWAGGLWLASVAGCLVAAELTVGLRRLMYFDTGRPEAPLRATKRWGAWMATGVLGGVCVGLIGVQTEPWAALALTGLGLILWTAWAIRRIRRHDEDG